MPVRPIRLFPDDVLSTPCPLLETFDRKLDELVRDLWDTMRASPGVGLAAPQIGVSTRVSVIDIGRVLKNRKMDSSYGGPIVIINPRIVDGEGAQTPREGCLSVPDLLANVRRQLKVRVACLDARGQEREIVAHGFEALALQHEIDHLDGKLFLDRVSNLKTDLFRRKGSG
jgi:peptide deformylase